MIVTAPKNYLDMCHLLAPELQRRYAKTTPVTLIDNYRGDEMIYGYFDNKQGIVLYLNRIFNPNKLYDTNKINFVIIFLHEAIHSTRGFKPERNETEEKLLRKLNTLPDFEKLYELDCRVATYQFVNSHIDELCNHPFDLDRARLQKALMREKCEILIKCNDIIALRRAPETQGRQLMCRSSYIPWARIGNLLFDLNNLPDILYNSLMTTTLSTERIFGEYDQYSGSEPVDSLKIEGSPITNINAARGKKE